MNIFSVNHLQDIDLNSLLSSAEDGDMEAGKFLSEPIDIFQFDITTLSLTDVVKKDFEISATNDGIVNGIAYWFTQDFGWDVRVTNYSESINQKSSNQFMSKDSEIMSLSKQACITFPSPVLVAKDERLKFKFLYSNGLIDFVHA